MKGVARAEAEPEPGMKVRKRTSKVKKERILLIGASKGATTSLLLLKSIVKRLRQRLWQKRELEAILTAKLAQKRD